MSKNRDKKAFTLVELIMVIVILSIVAAVIVYPLRSFIDLWFFINYKMESLWSARYIMDNLTTNLRMVGGTQSVSVATVSRFDFTNINGANISYNYSGGNLYKNGSQMRSGVSAFNFTYYGPGPNDTISTPIVSPGKTDIRYVGMNFTLTSSGQSVPIQSKVRCRDLN